MRFDTHRIYSLKNNEVALLSDKNTGWCILRKDGYNLLSELLSRNSITLNKVNDQIKNYLLNLWDSGLLLSDNKRNLKTISIQHMYPSVLNLKMTGSCNMACSYCYDFDSKRFKTNLNISKIKDTISFLLSKQPIVSILFHGGEPLLRFTLIKEIVNFALREAGSDRRLRFSIQTNGILIDSEVVNFFKHNNFSVGISLDGPSEQSNSLRIVSSGKTIFERVQLLFENFPEFITQQCGFLAVVSKTSYKEIPEFALWLQEQAVKSFSITFLDAVGRGGNLIHEVLNPEEAVHLYIMLLKMIKSGKIKDIKFINLLSMIDNLFTFNTQNLCNRGNCGAANEFLVLDTEGNYRTCDCVYDSFFIIGKSEDGILENIMYPSRIAVTERNKWLATEGDTCSICPLFALCGGTCVAKAIAKHGSPYFIDIIECSISKYVYHELLEELSDGKDTPLIDYYKYHMQLNKH